MKKISIICICLVLLTSILTTNVKAVDEACQITLTANETTLKPGDIVTIDVQMSNIMKPSGIAQFYGILEYSNDIFEVIFDEDPELKQSLAGTEYENCEILYSGAKDTSSSIASPWCFLYVNVGGTSGIYATTEGDPQIATQVIGKIKLKVKDGVTSTTTKVSLTEMEAIDAETIANSGNTGNLQGYKVSDTNINLTIKGTSQDNIQNVNNNTDNTKNNQKTNVYQNDKKDDKPLPSTGIKDILPIIIILIVISIIAYIKYKKYQDI